MNRFAIINKNVGETPLQALTAFRRTDSRLANVPMTYAGRLDPMAEGKMLILVGDECKKRKKYDRLDKEYEFEILFGVKSDTGDILGLAEDVSEITLITEESVRAVAKSLVGPHTLPYPVFSSKTVGSKQLFQHAHENTLSEIEIPTSNVRIYKIKCLGLRTVSSGELFKSIFSKLDLLRAEVDPARKGSDFRINDIRKSWRKIQAQRKENFTIGTFTAAVSSGTYIRTLAGLIARKLGTDGLAYSIRRTKLGYYFLIFRHIGIWLKMF